MARADNSAGSDTDLLMINLKDEMRHVSVGHLSLFIYPWRQLEEDARLGDLFSCHLVQEAKPLVDPDGYLPRLQCACFSSDQATRTISSGPSTSAGT